MIEEEVGAKLLAGNTYYFPGLANSGFKGGCLIDTGPEESIYDGFDIREVLITHGHADHFSSAAVLRRRGARIVASREEVSLIENPEINIRGMFSWAKPSDEMVTKLFRGEGCRVDAYLDQWHDSGIQVIPLPGHSLGHSGFLTEDGVLFTGDALYLKELWERHPLPYAIDVGLVKSSLELIDSLDFEVLVPAHGRPITKAESRSHIQYHTERIEAISTIVLAALQEACTTEEIIAAVSAELGLFENPAQYWLAVTTVKGFLASLMQQKLLGFFVKNHAGYWHTL
ncbi:MAG TPA: MBL fold metallo-hydrolase [Candidatus Aquicultor sp.]|jgi:glyoxylase-like metal-dependent hydrolase (beta-lactamase superfamily II)